MLQNEIENRLREIERSRTEECLHSVTIGLFAEEKLHGQEKLTAEGHLLGCPYCLKQLNDMKELLYYEKHPVKLSPGLIGRLADLSPEREKKSGKTAEALLCIERLKAPAMLAARQWRYGAVSLASAFAAAMVCLFLLRPGISPVTAPHVDDRSFVKVRALDADGKVIDSAEGVVVNPRGLVASNLHLLAGASAVQITLKDGRAYRTAYVWRDEDEDLAVMKIDNESLHSIPIGDVDRITVGQTVFLVPDRFGADRRFKESVVRDLDAAPGSRKGRPTRYIQLATLMDNGSRGTIVDRQGRLLGLLITEEKTINLAVPITDAERLVKEGRAVPVGELKGVRFSADALDLYLKGILASDDELWDEAIDRFRKAVALNPNLRGAHLGLGYAYYKRGLYNLEAREYEQVLKIDPESTDALFNLATNLQMRGRYEEAIEKYEKIVALDPGDAETQYQLGLAYLAQGNKEKAMAARARLKALNRGYAEMLRRLSEQ